VTADVSGVDLARQALLAAREQAKENGATTTKKSKRRTGKAVRRDGRGPLGLGEAIGMMTTERGPVIPAAGGSVLARWGDIRAAAASELAGHVTAVAFDADSGRLDVIPDSPAYGTKLRWSAQKLAAAAGVHVPEANVRALHVLPPATVKAGSGAAAADPANTAPEPVTPVRTREEASYGYHQALAAHQAANEQSDRLTPAVRAAIEQQGRVRPIRPSPRRRHRPQRSHRRPHPALELRVDEGHDNRIKMLKRQMFGRAGLQLLRRRVLLA
jgi:hypothetical protein